MKRPIFILLLSIPMCALWAQNPLKQDIQYIRDHFKTINELTSNMKPQVINLEGRSTEGGELEAYEHNELLIKMIVTYYGETGRLVEDFYFDDNGLIFAFVKNIRYNRPIFYTKEIAKEADDTEWFDESKSIILEDRYYYKDEELIRWINADKQMIPKSDDNFAEAAVKIWEEVYQLVELLDSAK